MDIALILKSKQFALDIIKVCNSVKRGRKKILRILTAVNNILAVMIFFVISFFGASFLAITKIIILTHQKDLPQNSRKSEYNLCQIRDVVVVKGLTVLSRDTA